MARLNDERSAFLKLLADSPFVDHAAKQAGIARSTVYRWMKDNPEFRKAVEKAKKGGRVHMVELGEIMLLKKVKEGDVSAIKFLLTHNSKRYRPKRADIDPLVSIEQWRLYMELHDWLAKNKPIPQEFRDKIFNAMKNWGFTDDEGAFTQRYLKQLESVSETEKSDGKKKE